MPRRRSIPPPIRLESLGRGHAATFGEVAGSCSDEGGTISATQGPAHHSPPLAAPKSLRTAFA